MTTTYKFKMICAECGNEFGSNRPHAEFCGTACRKVYNNRRAVRGAELYDIVMTWHLDRELSRPEKLLSLMGNLASAYKASDKHLRQGRRSYDRNAFKKIPLAFSKDVGDGR